MKIPLAIALALHAVLLGAGGRWARVKPAPAWSLAPEGAQEILIAAPPPPPQPEVAPPAPEPREASGGGQPSPIAAPPAPRPARLALRPQPADATPPAAEPPSALPVHASETSGAWEIGVGTSQSASAGGRGDPEGGGSTGTVRRRGRRAFGERWDAVAGPRAEEPPEHVAAADERILPRATIDAVVARSAGFLRVCYQNALGREPDLAGLIPVRLSVDPGGSVLVASDAGATVADPGVIRCVLSVFAAMTFPARGQGEAVWASYLVSFPPPP